MTQPVVLAVDIAGEQALPVCRQRPRVPPFGARWICTTCQPSPPVRCHETWSAADCSPSGSISGRPLRATMNVPQ